jgi:hypothetical protein
MPGETQYPVKKLVPLTEDLAKRVATYRFDERLPSENEAIRRLIELGLKAHAEKAAPNAPLSRRKVTP